MDRSIDQCATLFSLGQQLQERLALMAQKRRVLGPGDEPNNETLLSAPADSGEICWLRSLRDRFESQDRPHKQSFHFCILFIRAFYLF